MSATLNAARAASRQTWMTDLFRNGTRDGRDADPQDYQDALRSISDAYAEALLNGDGRVCDLATLAMAALLQRRPTRPIPY